MLKDVEINATSLFGLLLELRSIVSLYVLATF